MVEAKRKRRTSAIDRHIGACIRARRLALGVRQKALAFDIGVTMQQLQKYENGVNRVSASTLFEIAARLSTPVSAFFDGLPTEAAVVPTDAPSSSFERMAKTDEGLALADLFPQLADADRRRAVVEIVRVMVGGRVRRTQGSSAPD